MMRNRNERLLLLVGQLNYCWTNTESLLIHIMQYAMGTTRDVATITFLALNTTRARLNLIERLGKLPGTNPDDRSFFKDVGLRMRNASGVRNKYNHCIYGFDDEGTIESAQLMRVVDLGDNIKYGKIEIIDDNEIEKIKKEILNIVHLNKEILLFLNNKGI